VAVSIGFGLTQRLFRAPWRSSGLHSWSPQRKWGRLSRPLVNFHFFGTGNQHQFYENRLCRSGSVIRFPHPPRFLIEEQNYPVYTRSEPDPGGNEPRVKSHMRKGGKDEDSNRHCPCSCNSTLRIRS
jgi:hypothetical protein